MSDTVAAVGTLFGVWLLGLLLGRAFGYPVPVFFGSIAALGGVMAVYILLNGGGDDEGSKGVLPSLGGPSFGNGIAWALIYFAGFPALGGLIGAWRRRKRDRGETGARRTA